MAMKKQSTENGENWRTIQTKRWPSSFTREQIRQAIRYAYENRTYEVFYASSFQWVVKKPRQDAKPKYFSTKKEAVEFARDVCAKENMELVIRGKDGRIQDSVRHGIKHSKRVA